ncbi:hypothetical protein Poli38472_003534 [Pythium oligandrum]|uniref:D-isomer specific 2-hydroxyacid dehydrogenase NAD-binding domain-containing protein n=1 Tax=Pythium oligandrum TaxID=41045 RepID=A0A8K1C6P9_PYTOL|nr:hypothetical protein Poli38472_003534 [Pythium oligandrum]|eukprot:TMW57609.1 hypothetical protein Poli38472_003534 [Pythium oligandrum]
MMATMKSAMTYRVPVISSLQGLTDIVQHKLRTATCPAADLFRAQALEFVEIPAPTPVTPWKLTEAQTQVLHDAQILLGDAKTCAPLLLTPSETVQFRNLQWMQATYAGVESFQRLLDEHKLDAPKFALTRAGGVMPKAMAQYVLGWIVAIERKFFEARAAQDKKEWAKTALDYRPYSDLTVGILGMGDIGQEIGRLLKTAGFQVVGFKRNVNVLDAAASLDSAHRVTSNLQHVLEQADFVVSVLPSTPATRGLLNESNLVFCSRKKPVLINVGRGDLVDESALIQALDKKWLSRCVLDVFATEPLPEESPLWTHPLVSITPHVSAKSFPQDVADVFIRNLNLFLAREPMEYRVNWTHGY